MMTSQTNSSLDTANLAPHHLISYSNRQQQDGGVSQSTNTEPFSEEYEQQQDSNQHQEQFFSDEHGEMELHSSTTNGRVT